MQYDCKFDRKHFTKIFVCKKKDKLLFFEAPKASSTL